MQKKIDQNDYVALTEDAAIALRPDAGVLKVTGDDRRDFLHRITTNHVNNLSVGQSAINILTSPVARILFVFTVVALDDELLLLPMAGPAASLARHLRSQIFFMDNVQVADQSQDYVRLRYLGPNVDVLTQFLADQGQEASILDMQDGTWLAHKNALIIKQHTIDVPGFELVIPRGDQNAWIEGLVEAGARVLTDAAAQDARRIEIGRPWPEHELTDAYNPLEVDLGWVCADDKGCYTGQEIIARQVTYDKVTKSLVGLRSDEVLLKKGTQLLAEGRAVGEVTSSAFSLLLLAPIALGVIRRPHTAAGTTLTADGQPVTVAALPFIRQEEPHPSV